MRRRAIVVGIAALALGALVVGRTRSTRDLDRRSGSVTTVVSGDAIDVRFDDGSSATIALLGIDAPDAGELAEKSKAYLTARAANQRVTLRRDELARSGESAAYVYLSDGELLNESIVRDGWAFADRAHPCDFAGLFEQQENAARGAKRGLWRTITVDQMPAWRQRWMRERGLR